MTITVYGIPAPQGSKRHLGNGIMIESSKKVKPWREAVKWAFIESRGFKVEGPVIVDMVFTMPRPKSAKQGAMPSTRPDLDKLIRSTNDALSDVGAFDDDSRIVRLNASKVFPNGLGGLSGPGAIICITSAVRA